MYSFLFFFVCVSYIFLFNVVPQHTITQQNDLREQGKIKWSRWDMIHMRKINSDLYNIKMRSYVCVCVCYGTIWMLICVVSSYNFFFVSYSFTFGKKVGNIKFFWKICVVFIHLYHFFPFIFCDNCILECETLTHTHIMIK